MCFLLEPDEDVLDHNEKSNDFIRERTRILLWGQSRASEPDKKKLIEKYEKELYAYAYKVSSETDQFPTIEAYHTFLETCLKQHGDKLGKQVALPEKTFRKITKNIPKRNLGEKTNF